MTSPILSKIDADVKPEVTLLCEWNQEKKDLMHPNIAKTYIV